jgi:hypothetical protein
MDTKAKYSTIQKPIVISDNTIIRGQEAGKYEHFRFQKFDTETKTQQSQKRNDCKSHDSQTENESWHIHK